MNLAIFRSCVAGYSDRLVDAQSLAVIAGFWSGYYSNARRPKPLKTILEKMQRSVGRTKSTHASDVDVEEFKRREAAFKKRLQAKE